MLLLGGQGAALADNPAESSSEVPGVQMWQLYEKNQAWFLEAGNEFVRHCAHGGVLYLGSVAAPVSCQSMRSVQEEGLGSAYKIVLDAGRRPLPAVVLVSLRPLPERVPPQPLSEAEKAEIARLLPALALQFQQEYRARVMRRAEQEPQALEQYEEALALAVNDAYLQDQLARVWKVRTPSGPVYLAPLGLRPTPDGGIDIEQAVLRRTPRGLAKTDSIPGCLQGLRDVDRDGFPDVLTRSCEPGEGGVLLYWSLRARPRVLMKILF